MRCLIFFLALTFLGCGDRITDADDNTDALLVGLWDSITNNQAECHERLRLNSDKTFWWYFSNQISKGTYGINPDGLDFEFTDRAWQIMNFSVTDRELRISRLNESLLFIRVPKGADSPCPGEKKPRPGKPKKPDQNPIR